ncbi:hypothetical protein G6F56_007409 [Rhizopus delemar]|nr:hypothetical protein G6F56_007409 [Rhizopus delemar]
MRLSLTSLIFSLLIIISSICTSPVIESKEFTINDIVSLTKRQLNYPVTPSDTLVRNIMDAFKDQLNENCLAEISSNYTKTVNGSLNVSIDVGLSLLGGLIRLGEFQVKAIRERAIKRMKERMDTEIQSNMKAAVYSPIEQDLRSMLGSNPLYKHQLLAILVSFEEDAKELVNEALSKLDADLELRLYKELGLGVTGTQITIPNIANITISADLDKSGTLESSIQAAAEDCLAVDAKAEAQSILDVL